ncbi:SPFH domain-containing protein [Streptomyces venezuelae]|uniref:SPFH domain-containing protein n=1 Tax=Streptomyces venezuelae TaxID=54571 RepID=UPI003F53F158
MDLLFRGDTAELPKVAKQVKGAKEPGGLMGRSVSDVANGVRPPAGVPPRVDREVVERRGSACSGWWAVFVAVLALVGAGWLAWAGGLVPGRVTEFLRVPDAPRARHGLDASRLPAIGACGFVVLCALGGLSRGRAGSAWVLSLFGRYRGSVRRTGLVWISPLVLRRRVDVRLRHWRSDPMPAVDAQGVELRVVVLVVWQVKDTARALLTVDDHTAYLAEQVEAVTARVASRLPADSFRDPADGDVPTTLRDAEAVGDALTRALAAECRAVGIEVFSARPTRVEYAPEVAAAMQRRQIAAIDAKHRDTVLTSVLDAVDDTVRRLTERGLVALDDYERKALVKDLTVAFYTARGSAVDTH